MNLDLESADKLVNLSKAPFRMHEFFAGSGLVAYGMKGMFMPVWSNDINDRKACLQAQSIVHYLNVVLKLQSSKVNNIVEGPITALHHEPRLLKSFLDVIKDCFPIRG